MDTPKEDPKPEKVEEKKVEDPKPAKVEDPKPLPDVSIHRLDAQAKLVQLQQGVSGLKHLIFDPESGELLVSSAPGKGVVVEQIYQDGFF